MRARIKELEADSKKAAGLEKELAFAKAGVDLEDHRTATYFVPGYKGEMTSEAIRAAAEADGFLKPTEAPVDQDQAALERIAQAAITSATPEIPGVGDQQDKDLQEAIRKGEIKSEQDIATFLMARNQPVEFEGPRPYGDGSIFRPITK